MARAEDPAGAQEPAGAPGILSRSRVPDRLCGNGPDGSDRRRADGRDCLRAVSCASSRSPPTIHAARRLALSGGARILAIRMLHTAYIGLGSNLGDRRTNLDAAIRDLGRHPQIEVGRVSSWLETEPVGGPPGQPRYLNGAAELRTTLPPHDLLRTLQRIESRLGRVRLEPWGPRTLDLDLLLYDDLVLNDPELTVPHPRLPERRFALEPLAQIAPTAIHPATGLTIAELLARLPTT